MNYLVTEIAGRVRAFVQRHSVNENGQPVELRSVFHGPPTEILQKVFLELQKDGGIQLSLSNGAKIVFPVLLQVGRLLGGEANPDVGKSGICDESYLLTLRNSPDCPRYVALVAPGNHRNLSVASASNDFGLSAVNNSGTATIDDWWSDEFIQEITRAAFVRAGAPLMHDAASSLIYEAVKAADQIERHDTARRNSWMVLSRLSCIETQSNIGSKISLACGFPPLANGQISPGDQIRVLEEISELMVNNGFQNGIDQCKAKANEKEVEALDAFLAHLRISCDIPTAFAIAAPFFYQPERAVDLKSPPTWWETLTLDCWVRLLENDDEERDEAISLECVNALLSGRKGLPAVVLDKVCIEARCETAVAFSAVLTREIGPTASRRTWVLQLPVQTSAEDENPPAHRTPIRYRISSNRGAQAALRIVSLREWTPGLVVTSQTASKTTLPKSLPRKRDGVSLEAGLTLIGHGRHYIEILVRPDITLVDFSLSNESELSSNASVAEKFSQISDHSFGFEVDISADCYCDIQFTDGSDARILRINLEPKETSAVGCSSEFERLIRLNSGRDRGRAASTVNVSRQTRLAELQSSMLDTNNAELSYLPIVLGRDCATNWRMPDWHGGGTVISNAAFLQDPRPQRLLFAPPADFTQARSKLAALIRQEDGAGMIEAARIGEWAATDTDFSTLVETYLSSYLGWMDADPDVASWVDLAIIASTERGARTLMQEPDAILVSPLHPIRLAWQVLAQRSLFLALRANMPCPAASILDPTRIPDIMSLPMSTAAGGIKRQYFLSLESSSDYWGVLWNGDRLEPLSERSREQPFDREFGLTIGGVSSGFSVSQVQRALNDISEMLPAKPVLSVVISSASGLNSACDEGLLKWCRANFGQSDLAETVQVGPKTLQVFDDRPQSSRPDDSTLANLAEDTANAVRWFDRLAPGVKPDLGVIAQLESSSPALEPVELFSAVSEGALIRHRVRRQLQAQSGAFLVESRAGAANRPTGDGLADKLMSCVVRLENADERVGYTFAPSVHSIRDMLKEKRVDFAAVSSSAVDPACFLGRWLDNAYLWDYNLPSYSQRAGDNNGYYLLSQVKDLDRDTLRNVLARLPGRTLGDEDISSIITEVARRGIPTVRGLSGGDRGASGDLGLLLASRLLQDEFRENPIESILPVLTKGQDEASIGLIIAVDPFRGYFDDLQGALDKSSRMRPDLLAVGMTVTNSTVRCKLTPIEVKYRSGLTMTSAQRKDALLQAKSLSELLNQIKARSEQSDLVIWRLAFQHLLSTIIGYGFRVYSQQQLASDQSKTWSTLHGRVMGAILSGEFDLTIDGVGRLIAFDTIATSLPHDTDEDGFRETVVISPHDAAKIIKDDPGQFYLSIKNIIGDWKLMPGQLVTATVVNTQATRDEPLTAAPPTAPINLGRNTTEMQPSIVEPRVKNEPAVQEEPTTSRLEEASALGEGIVLELGTNVDGFEHPERYLNISDTQLNQLNIGVVGDLGTGKTQLLKSLIYQLSRGKDRNAGVRPNLLLFDYKQDYSSDDFVAAMNARVAPPYNLPINLFDISESTGDPHAWLRRYQFFSDVLDKIYSGIGPVQRQNLKRAVRASYDDAQRMGRQPTIYDVHSQYQTIIGQKADSVFSILDDLVDMQLFSAEPTPGGSAQFFQGVVVIELNRLGQDDRSKNMLVAIMLNLFYEHMLRIPKRPYRGDSPQLRTIDSFLLVDEADNIMRFEFDVLRKLLLQGREFGVGVILASQYLRHFKTGGTDYREPLLTWFVHKVPSLVPQELQALGLTSDLQELAERVKTLPNHHCLFKTVGAAGEILNGLPFYRLASRTT